MSELRCWIIFILRFLRYFAYRVGLVKQVTFMDIRYEAMIVVSRVFGWHKRLRIVHGERCPRNQACVFAINHTDKLDPFVAYTGIYHSSKLRPQFMARDDFFASIKGKWWNRLLDLDELTVLHGTIQISRGAVTLGQMKPFVQLLRDNKCFIMYPTGTRTRSGLVTEYRGGMEEPGSVAFFIAQAQRRRASGEIVAVPLARTCNMATDEEVFVFGDPLPLADKADRSVQRQLDFDLILRIADLVEINAVQVVSGLLYLRCLHGLPETLETPDLVEEAQTVFDSIAERPVAPDCRDHLDREVGRALDYLASRGQLTRKAEMIILAREAVLSVPPEDVPYQKSNPLKYCLNQILHCGDVMAVMERVVLKENR
jgi:1-acyl-sn-glycerol-3-phosphate acyltransferase